MLPIVKDGKNKFRRKKKKELRYWGVELTSKTPEVAAGNIIFISIDQILQQGTWILPLKLKWNRGRDSFWLSGKAKAE